MTMMRQKMLMRIEMKENVIPRKTVLVVDDNEQICRAMSRRLGPLFDEVFVATDPREAARILEDSFVTHVLCDFDLGFGIGLESVTGYGFVQCWRREFPEIRRTVVFSGTDLSRLEKPREVDAVVRKTEAPDMVVEALLGEDFEPAE
jgi:CheY-like chemotaxis protein